MGGLVVQVQSAGTLHSVVGFASSNILECGDRGWAYSHS